LFQWDAARADLDSEIFLYARFAMIGGGEQRISLSIQDAAAADFCLSET